MSAINSTQNKSPSAPSLTAREELKNLLKVVGIAALPALIGIAARFKKLSPTQIVVGAVTLQIAQGASLLRMAQKWSTDA